MTKINYIIRTKKLSEVCSCILNPNLLTNYRDEFYETCLVDNLDSEDIKQIRLNSNTFLLIILEDLNNMKFNSTFFFSFHYRKENNYILPCYNLSQNSDQAKYLYYLIEDYINKPKSKANFNVSDKLNPLYMFNPFFCYKHLHLSALLSQIIIIPQLHIDLISS